MEQTFEELIEDDFRNDSLLTQLKVLKLLQQVREATIAECASQCEEIDSNTRSRISVLETDRIKIEK